MAFLELDALSKRYGDVVAVDGLSLAVERGEFVSLLGPSGCGKTTTLQMIAGFEELSAGAIRVDGRDIGRVSPSKRGIGIVFQSYALFPHMTVTENVGFGLEMRKVGRDERRSRVEDALELVHLSGLGHRYPRALSGGQQQRVALARSLVIKPDLLLLDEPLSNLDAKLREEMQIELRNIQQTTGVTTILVTHDQTEAMALSDRIAVMHGGRIVQLATPFEAYEFPATDFVSGFLGKTNLLDVSVSAPGRVTLAGREIVVGNTDAAIEGPALLSVRPEKIRFVPADDSIVQGTVCTGVFLGNQWLFQVETAIGTMLVVHQNSGRPEAKVGDLVGLYWAPDQIRLLPADARS